MFNEFNIAFKSTFANDYIKVGRKKIRPFSFAWFVVGLSKVLIGVLSFYLLYCCLWMAAA